MQAVFPPKHVRCNFHVLNDFHRNDEHAEQVEQEKTWTKNLKELSPEQAEKMKVPDVPDDEKAKMGWVKTEQLGWVYKGGK